MNITKKTIFKLQINDKELSSICDVENLMWNLQGNGGTELFSWFCKVNDYEEIDLQIKSFEDLARFLEDFIRVTQFRDYF